MTGAIIIRVGMLLAGALFIFAAAKPAFTGGSMNATFFVIGIACALIGFAVGRKPSGPRGSAGA
ncbi:MAG: hypothetical protein HY700_16960 [Gemmatimonadetes bacterium]|nr:hypothetical protein [Gemmatimonadota bacterium]